MADAEPQQHQHQAHQAAQDQAQAPDSPIFIPEDDDEPEEAQQPAGTPREPVNVDALPDTVYLQTTRSWVPKADVPKRIREQYSKIMKALGAQALHGSKVKQRLDDYAIAAARAPAGKLIERHANAWGPALRGARDAAKDEMEKAEKALAMFVREDDSKDVGRAEARATARWEKACRGCVKAAALIKELKDVSARD